MDYEKVFLIGYNENIHFNLQDDKADKKFFESIRGDKEAIRPPKILATFSNPDPQRYLERNKS